MHATSNLAPIYRHLADALADADFPAYAQRYLKIIDKAGALIPLRLNLPQHTIHAAIERQLKDTGKVRALIAKGRQMGASTYVEARYFWETTRRSGQQAFILTNTDDATRRVFGMCKRFLDNCPPVTRPSIRASNARELLFDQLDSGYTVATAGSAEPGRASTLQYVHGSEVAFWPNADAHLSGLLQAVPDQAGTEVILESTSNGPKGLFYEMCQAAQRGETDYCLIFTPWHLMRGYRRTPPPGFALTDDEAEYAREHGLDDRQMCWRRAKIAELFGLHHFRREYPSTVEEAFKAEAPGALWKREIIEGTRVREAPPLRRIVVGIDPSGGSKSGNDEAGIVVAGLAHDGHCYVLEDVSGRMSPNAWGARGVAAYQRHKADRIIAEQNYGGEMVRHTIATVDRGVPIKLVSASRGKQVRAEPIAALYEQGKVHHVGTFAALEDELVTWDPTKTQRSPNRLDALVWAITELVPAQSTTGLLDYYLNEAARVEQERRDAGKVQAKATLENGGVRMRCPSRVNMVLDLAGRPIFADQDGVIIVSPRHAEMLKRSGFTLIDQESTA